VQQLYQRAPKNDPLIIGINYDEIDYIPGKLDVAGMLSSSLIARRASGNAPTHLLDNRSNVLSLKHIELEIV
jgi:hypothetical protein